MKHLLAVFAVVLLSGCSLLSNTTPQSNFYAMRAGLEQDGQNRKLKPANVLEVPNSWNSENLLLEIHETYAKPTQAGEEVIQTRDISLYRLTDPTVAGNVAIHKASETRVFAGDVTKGVVSLAALYASMGASGGLEAIIPAVKAAIEAMSKQDQDKTAAAIQEVVSSDITPAEKAKKIGEIIEVPPQ